MHAARTPLRLEAVAIPTPGPGEVLPRVHACAVCRTDLHAGRVTGVAVLEVVSAH